MTPLADLSALEDRMTVDDTNRALAALDDASAFVRAAAGADWVDAEGNLDAVPAVVVAVTLAVARRLYENPDGFESETIGDYTYRRGDGSNGLLPHEVRAVRKAAGSTSVGSVGLDGYLDGCVSTSMLANGGTF